MQIKLDQWQKDILSTTGNICLRSGRQVGKSTIISVKAAEYAVNEPGKTVMILSAVERQAYLLFEKVLGYITDNYKSDICRGSKKPTKHKITLKNVSVIYCLPTGLTGYGIRGYTVDLLIVDGAAFCPPEVFQAITPMLSTTKGHIILLSTPFGREGYFYDCFSASNFTAFHISSLDCPRIDKEFIESERKRMTRAQFAQEYLGEFVDELRRFFPDDIIRKCLKINLSTPQPPKGGEAFLGVDVARMGEDQSTFISVRKHGGMITQIGQHITERSLLTDSISTIKYLDSLHHYRQIYIDSSGVGAGVFDVLLADDQTKRKVVSIENARKSLDRDDKKRKKLMKEDLYANLLRLMERGEIELYDDDDLRLSLKSMQYEYVEDRLRIFGDYSHLAEALVRAAWCVTERNNGLWVKY